MSTPTVYVICDKNCKFEGMTKEQIITAITQAVNEGTVGDIDAGFITTIKTINGVPLQFFVGQQAAYDNLTDAEKKNVFAIITNDTTKEALNAAIDDAATKATNAENTANAASLIVNNFETRLSTVESKASASTTKLSKAFPTPAANTAKKLTSAGYYYIAATAGSASYYSYGVIYWDGSSFVSTPYAAADNSYIYELQISSSGAITMLMDAGKGTSDMTSEFTFYTAKIWG